MIKMKYISLMLLLTFFLSLGVSSFPIHCFADPTNEIDGHEPARPYSFTEEEVSFVNPQAGVTIFGSLDLPKGPGPYPVVEWISGGGPYPRGPESKTFAGYLTQLGIAVLRYDKRGTGKSSGDYKMSTSQDYANDAACGVKYLKSRKEIDPNKIGIVGGSEGSMIGTMVAAHSKDVAFLVMMSGPGLRGDQIVLHQWERIDYLDGMPLGKQAIRLKILPTLLEETVKQKDDAQFKSWAREIVRKKMAVQAEDNPTVIAEEQEFWEDYVNKKMRSPWMKFFLLCDPKTSLRMVKCPVLAVGGDKDLNIIPSENFPAIEEALKEAKNKDYLFKLFPNVGHDMKTRKPNSFTELIDPLQIIAPDVLVFVGDWIEKHTKN